MIQEQLYEFCVPSHLPMRSNVPRDTESLTKFDAQFILRWIAWTMWNLQVREESDFVEVAFRALKRYPSLESTLNNEKGLVSKVFYTFLVTQTLMFN